MSLKSLFLAAVRSERIKALYRSLIEIFIIILNELYIMGENSSAIGIGVLVFVVFLVIMLAAFNTANNLTTGTVLGTILTGLFIWFLVTAAIEQ